jgi:hypothetical protein
MSLSAYILPALLILGVFFIYLLVSQPKLALSYFSSFAVAIGRILLFLFTIIFKILSAIISWAARAFRRK